MAYTLKQLVMAWSAVHGGVEPDATTLADLGNRAAQNAAGAMTDAQALGFVINSADNSTALAVLSYQFFTGKSPTAEGLTYLLNSAANPNDLGDAYYAQFSTENRYINFAANLGVQGEGAAAFAGKYGTMSFAAYVASIYETIIGATYAKAAGLDADRAIADIVARQDAILATARSAGMITEGMTAAQIDLAVKAAAAGYLLGEAIKADVGLYAGAANNFAVALATGTATYGGDITTTYKPSADQGAGLPVTQTPPDSALPGYEPPPPPPEPEPKPAATPQTFTLTTGTDTFTGGRGDDTFTATTGTGATLNAGDKLNGAGGVDTLTITNAAATTVAMADATITNIEKLRVTSTTADLVVDMAGTSFAEARIVSSNRFVTLSNLASTATALGVTGAVNSAIFTFTDAALAGANDTVTLNLTDVSSALSVNISEATTAANQFETLSIVSGGSSNSIKLTTSSASTSLSTIKISGSTPLAFGFSGSSEKTRTVATIDASAATGALTIGATTSTLGVADQTIQLGSGDDIVFFGTNLTSADTVDGGAGFDIVSVSAAISGSTVMNGVSNVEAVRFNRSGSPTQDVSVLAGHGLSEVQIEGSSLSSVQFNNLPASGITTVAIRSNATTLSLILADGSGSADSLTLKIGATTSLTMSNLSAITGLETLNIVSGGSSATNRINANFVTAKQVITGTVDLTMTAGSTAALNIDASAFTGKLTFTDANSTPGRNDTVVLGLGADTLSLRTGLDTIFTGPTANPNHAYRGADVITVSSSGAITLGFSDNTETVGGGGSTSYAGVTAVSLIGAGTATLQFNAGDDAFSIRNAAGASAHGLSKGAASHGLNAGDTVVVQEVAQNDVAAAATADVTLIRLTTQTAFTTDIKGTFAAAMGTASVTGLAADSAYLVSLFDGTKTLLAIVNTGADHAGDTTLSAADFTDTGIVLIGTFGATTPGLFSGMFLAAAF